MFAGLGDALAKRKQYVDNAGSVTEAAGTGTGRAELSSAISSGGSKFVLLQGGLEKSPTGFTGLVNQGATCYLNSLIQSLFMVPEFRQALYAWEFNEADHGEEDRCLSRQLQRLFAQLQLSKRAAVTTGSLTKSFGWSGSEAFVQQDVQECMSVIFAHLEMQSLWDHIPQMHEGKSFDYLKCHKCGQSRGHPEKFRDLQLGVRGMTSLQQSFEAYTCGEEMEGVECPHCGTRETHTKGIAFRKLPEIMTLQLRRFDMNYETMQRVKVNDAVDIPAVIDMAPFITTDDGGEGEGAPAEGAGGPMEYELISICMHIGSALSGHYFAYIKESGTGRWLNFNDANVTELEQSQLAGILSTLPPEEDGAGGSAGTAAGESGIGGAAAVMAAAAAAAATKKPADASAKVGERGGPAPVKPATSNAYMLVYRKLHGGNVHTVDEALVPAAVKVDIDEENEKFDKLKAEWEEERKWLNMTVYHTGPAKPLKVHEDRTVAELTQMAFDLFSETMEGEGVPIERVRLRWFDALKNACLAPLDNGSSGSNPTTMETKLKDLPEEMVRRPLKFEVKEEGGEFEDYLANGLPLSIMVYDADKQDFGEPLPLSVDPDATVGQLREAVATRAKLDLERTSIVWYPGDMAFGGVVPLADPAVTLKSLKIGDVSSTLHVEDKLPSEPSKLSEYFEGLSNMITINFNDPRTAADAGTELRTPTTADAGVAAMVKGMHADELALNGEKKYVQVDQRKPLGDLKDQIAAEIGMAPSEFKLRRGAGGQEYKDLGMAVALHGLEEGHTIHIKLGKPMEVGEWQFNLKYCPELDGDVGLLGPFVLNEAMSIPDVKATLHATFGESHGVPPPDRMRLRTAQSTGVMNRVKLGSVLTDDSIIAEVFGTKIADGKMIAIQVTSGPEVFTSEHILLRARHWSPVSKVLGDVEEIGVLRTGNFGDLRVALAPSVNEKRLTKPLEDTGGAVEPLGEASVDDVYAVKPFAYLLKDLANLPTLKWEPQPKAETKLANWGRLKDGDLIVYKDNREPEDITPEMADKLAAEQLQTTIAHEEAGFQIFSPQQQKEREEARKIENEQLKKEQEEKVKMIHAAAMERANEDADSPATQNPEAPPPAPASS